MYAEQSPDITYQCSGWRNVQKRDIFTYLLALYILDFSRHNCLFYIYKNLTVFLQFLIQKSILYVSPFFYRNVVFLLLYYFICHYIFYIIGYIPACKIALFLLLLLNIFAVTYISISPLLLFHHVLPRMHAIPYIYIE